MNPPDSELPPDTGGPSAAGGLTRITFNAPVRVVAAIDALSAASGDNRTDVINTALRLASTLLTLAQPNGTLHVLAPDGIVVPGWVSDNTFLAGSEQRRPSPDHCSRLLLIWGRWPAFPPAGFPEPLLRSLRSSHRESLCLLGTLPFWHGLRDRPRAQAAMRGTTPPLSACLVRHFTTRYGRARPRFGGLRNCCQWLCLAHRVGHTSVAGGPAVWPCGCWSKPSRLSLCRMSSHCWLATSSTAPVTIFQAMTTPHVSLSHNPHIQ